MADLALDFSPSRLLDLVARFAIFPIFRFSPALLLLFPPMEITAPAIQAVIFESIKELNEQLAPEQQLKPAPETELLGATGTLDSLSFVNLVSILEEKLQSRFGVAVVLSGEPMDAGKRDPFTNVASLTEYIELVVRGNTGAWK